VHDPTRQGYATGLVGPVIQWNPLWLLTIVVMPFTTKLLTGEADAFEVRFTGYAVDQALAALFLVPAFSGLRRSGLPQADASAEVIPFVTHWASLCRLLLPVLRLGLRSVRRRTLAANMIDADSRLRDHERTQNAEVKE
jgi:hypothetical protein